MSLSKDGRTITCDGPGAGLTGCPHTMRLPIGLRQRLRPNESPPAHGWLCVARSDNTCHYCPDCAPGLLKSLAPAGATPGAEWIGEENEVPSA